MASEEVLCCADNMVRMSRVCMRAAAAPCCSATHDVCMYATAAPRCTATHEAMACPCCGVKVWWCMMACVAQQAPTRLTFLAAGLRLSAAAEALLPLAEGLEGLAGDLRMQMSTWVAQLGWRKPHAQYALIAGTEHTERHP